jgi:prepilin-type processing-associated H-X9-DG protein
MLDQQKGRSSMSQAALTSGGSLDNVTPARRGSVVRYLVWAVGIVVIGGMLIAVMLPSLCRSRETANRVKCAANLKSIGQAISLYAQDHDGHYPASLAMLPSVQDISADVMVCPSSNDERSEGIDTAAVVAELTAAETNAPDHKHCLSYVYTGQALTEQTATPTAVVAYEPLTNHDGDGMNVLFGDGHVEFISKEYWPKIAGGAGIAIAQRPDE